MSEFDNVTAPPPPTTGEAPQDQRTMSLLAHLLGIVTGPIGALIIWLVSKDDASKGFVVDQSKEALNFQLTLLGVYIIGTILSLILIGVLINLAAWVACIVLSIMAGLAAQKGEYYRYPFAVRLIK